MSLPTDERRRYFSRYDTVNATWRARWGNHLSYAMMIAVAIHAAAFAFWPAFDGPDSLLDPELELVGTAWTVLYPPPPSSPAGGGAAMAALAVLVQPDSVPLEEVDAPAIIGGAEVTREERSAGLRERLAGRDSPVPTLVQLSPAVGPPGIGDDRADNREAEVDVPTEEEAPIEELALLMEASPLDLSRLSAVRPQIVLPGTSAWILIRNPSEVDRFMNGFVSSGDSEAQGLVDVAVWIDEWGSVEWAEISRSSGHQEMDEMALALFNEVASFRPARDQGVRVSMSVIFSVPFPW